MQANLTFEVIEAGCLYPRHCISRVKGLRKWFTQESREGVFISLLYQGLCCLRLQELLYSSYFILEPLYYYSPIIRSSRL